ncbi:hypothetical protein [Billgrantia desiderata]|uniref:hypothetical protein n=1 Tax=Billgrantia desiderata TaxID=52021 RepID=UPI001F481704|nr:hypothetical protein [Halomonas desiderata]MCE8014342.1 hypothetical protein [Halomonas desiderata]
MAGEGKSLLEPDEAHEATLVSGMIWRNSDVVIRLEAENVMDQLDVNIDVLSVQESVNLSMSRWSNCNRVHITDLNGNKAGNALYDQGYGTLAMNLGIQLVYFYFNIPVGHPQARILSVTGNISHKDALGDPGSQEYVEDTTRRVAFWRRFGFQVSDESHPKPFMSAKLGDLRILGGPDTVHGVSRTLSLSTFMPISQP